VLQKVCRGQKAARRVVRRAAVAVAPRYGRYAGRRPPPRALAPHAYAQACFRRVPGRSTKA